MTGWEQQLCEMRIGTSGYDYRDWEDVFYSKGIGKSNYFGTYSETFDTIELTSTFTTMPTEADMKKLIMETRKAMDFAVKAPMALFSSIYLKNFDDNVGAFRKGIAPLAEGDKLYCVLLSFSKAFHYGIEERKYLNKILSALSMYPLVVEFNNNEWISARVLDGLKARGIGLCLHDMPHLEGLSIVYDVVTAPLAYIRFQGRNTAAWASGDALGKHDYLYTRDELESWIPRIESIEMQAKKLRIFFDNHRKGSAVENALELRQLCRKAYLL